MCNSEQMIRANQGMEHAMRQATSGLPKPLARRVRETAKGLTMLAEGRPKPPKPIPGLKDPYLV